MINSEDCMPDSVSRRRMLGATLGAAVALPLVACRPHAAEATDVAPTTLDMPPSARNVRDYGAVGDGVADDTAAVARAYAEAPGPVVLYLPAGKYLVTAWPDLP